jgi:pantothenate kinase
VLPQHRIIIIEGLYTLLDQEDWREAAQEMDMRVFVGVDRAVARGRCIKRNFAAGLSVSEEATAHRGESVQNTVPPFVVRTDIQQSMSPTWSTVIWWPRDCSLPS